MAEKKSSSAKKSGTAGTPAKRPYTKKPKPPVVEETKEPVVKIVVESPAPEKPAVEVVDIGRVLSEDEKVPLMIPFDPAFDDENQMWECGYNGKMLRFKRGVMIMQPKCIRDFVMWKIDLQNKSAQKQREWLGAGKKLNY